jgi:hypothetical protein
MADPQQTLTEYLAERVRGLQKQQDESAWNETALIATLKELLPGFGPRFDQLHSAVQKMTSPASLQELEELLTALKNKKSPHG